MNIHSRARLTPLRREEMARLVTSGRISKTEAGRRFGVSIKTVSRWVARYRQAGSSAMIARSSRPHHSLRRIVQPVEQAINALRRDRLCGAHVARQLNVSAATVSRVLKRAGLSRMKDLAPAEPQRRYEYSRPGEMIHLDIKKLGRFNQIGHRITGNRKGQSNQRTNGTAPGWEYVHVCIDDHSRLSFSQIHPDEKAASAIAHLNAAVAWYKRMGITVTRVMTDNGACYKSKAFARTCRGWVSATSEPNPIRQGQTARQNASSRPPCESGPMQEPTKPQTSAPTNSKHGSTSTIGTDPTVG